MILKCFVTLIILILVFSKTNTDAFYQIFNGQTFSAICLIQFPLLLATLLNVKRHCILVRDPTAPFATCFAAILLSAGLNLVIPGRISEIVKATYIRQKLNIPLANGISAIVIERLMDVLIVACIGTFGVISVFLNDNNILTLMLMASITALIFLRPIANALFHLTANHKNFVSRFIYENCSHVEKILSLKNSFFALSLSLFSWTIHCFAIWLFFWSLTNYQITFAEATLVFSAIIFAGAIPSLPGGLGVIQAAIVLVLTHLEIPFEEALLLSFALHFAEILIAAVIAPIILILQPTGIGDLMKQISSLKKT
jgi:uncharacterized protein (TIRG00374 family)